MSTAEMRRSQKIIHKILKLQLITLRMVKNVPIYVSNYILHCDPKAKTAEKNGKNV